MEGRGLWTDWLIQMSANLVGTLLAAGIIYLVGVLAGVITGQTVVTILSVLGAAAGLAVLPVLNRLSARLQRDTAAVATDAIEEFIASRRERKDRDP
jgi:hypothetical protein